MVFGSGGGEMVIEFDYFLIVVVYEIDFDVF